MASLIINSTRLPLNISEIRTPHLNVAPSIDEYVQGSSLTIGLAITLAIISVWSFRAYQTNSSKSSLGEGRTPWRYGIPLISDLEFFSDSEGFLRGGFKKFGDTFVFRFLKHKVIAVGPNTEARKIFVQNRDLNVMMGWNAIRGLKAANLRRAKMNVDKWVLKEDLGPFTKRAAVLLRKERIEHYLPVMVKEVVQCVDKWKGLERFSPWDEYYNIVMHLLLHLSAFKEITSSPQTVQRFCELFRGLEETYTFGSAFFPRLSYVVYSLPFAKYFLGENKVKREMETVKEIVGYLKPIIKQRYADRDDSKDGDNKAASRVDDQPQLLIDQGDKPSALIQFLWIMLFIGLVNQFRTACWMTAYVLSNPKYKELIVKEVKALLDESPADPTESIAERLSQVPLEIWETRMPVFDSCVRETIRLTLHGITARMNIGDKSIVFPSENNGQVKVAPGEFAVLSASLVHMDENIYPEPTKWDPSRYERNEGSDPFTYLGWGAGRHICPGKRVAEIHIKLILSVLLLEFPDCSLELENGTLIDDMSKLPGLDIASQEVSGYPTKPIYIRCSK